MNWNDKPKYRKSYYNTPTPNPAPLTPNQNNPSPLTPNQLRGALSKIMTESQKAEANIYDLTYDFASRIIRLYQFLSEDSAYREYTMSKQVLRSGTSVGANIREAKHAQSRADFLSKMSIAYKEADETSYWLHLLHDNGYLNDTLFRSINTDCDRINRILSSITKTTRENLKKPNPNP